MKVEEAEIIYLQAEVQEVKGRADAQRRTMMISGEVGAICMQKMVWSVHTLGSDKVPCREWGDKLNRVMGCTERHQAGAGEGRLRWEIMRWRSLAWRCNKRIEMLTLGSCLGTCAAF